MQSLVVIAHNLRSTHNVGSLLRTAEGLGVDTVILTGYSPYPVQPDDTRLPHIAQKLHKQISKTALGAEDSQAWVHNTDIVSVISDLKAQGYTIAALEQTPASIPMPSYDAPDKLALVLGREVEGLEANVLALCDLALEIPMAGIKESFNVVQAAAMAMYDVKLVKRKG